MSENSGLVDNDDVSLASSSSPFEEAQCLHLQGLIPEDEGTVLLRNVGNHELSDTASYLRRP